MKKIFLIITFAACCIESYAQIPSDTTLIDITKEYKIFTPVFPDPYLDDVSFFQVAIIPTDSLGKKEINWGENVRLSDYWHEKIEPYSEPTEAEFELSLLKCKPSSDSLVVKTMSQKTYCRRRGFSDSAAGSRFEINHVSFTKEDEIVIMAFVIRWTNCYNTDNIEKCKEDEKRKEARIDSIIDKIVAGISFEKIE